MGRLPQYTDITADIPLTCNLGNRPRGVSVIPCSSETISSSLIFSSSIPRAMLLRLYEEEPPHRRMNRLGEYRQRWVGWAGVADPVLAP
jgi:hypothetical protein